LWTPEGLDLLHSLPLPRETIGYFTGEVFENRTVRTISSFNEDGSISQREVDDTPFVQELAGVFPGAELSPDKTQMRWNGLLWGQGALSRRSEEGADSAVYGELRKVLEQRGFDGIFASKTPSMYHYDFDGKPVFHEEILLFHPIKAITFVGKDDIGENRPAAPRGLGFFTNLGRGRKSRKPKRKQRRNTRKRTSRKVK
jgi:hypothetical protein